MSTMRVTATAAIVLLVIGLAGCGGDEPTRTSKPAKNARNVAPTRAEIERFGRIKLPASTSDLQASREDGMDSSIAVRFTMDRGELKEFIDGANFRAPPTPDDRAIGSNERLGWKVDEIQSLVGHSELENALGRQIVIDLDRPERPVVYFVASTI